MDLIDLPEFGPDDYQQIVDGEFDPFGTDHLCITWRDKSGHVGMMEEGRLIAHAGWVPVQVRESTGQILNALGFGGVMVHRDHRGRGVGQTLVSGAMDKMRQLDVSIAMLFCRTVRLAFYERLGWLLVGGTVTADQPDGLLVMPLETCWTPLVVGAGPPQGDLHVEGLPF